MRKKYSQISFLHVYHHLGMCILGFIGTKYVPGKLPDLVTATVLTNKSPSKVKKLRNNVTYLDKTIESRIN